jgi:serine/threonine protein kinase
MNWYNAIHAMLEEFGRYTLLDRLGYGGMAEVFLARTNGVGGFEKLLAIKRLLPHCVEDRQTVDLLADEARITVQLTHPNIVQVFDFGRVEDSYFIAMEYVDGLDLKTLIQLDEQQSRPVPLPVALHITSSVLEGLDFAHKRSDHQGESLGIIHRDVTPHNVLISRHGQVKLTDFGVARARISIHVSIVGDIRGKFSYMPPEQACGGEIDHRVDIFAAGAILYELLCGQQPFRSSSTGEQMKLLSGAIPPPSKFNPEVPRSLDAIALKALAPDPEKRFAWANEFATELKGQLESLGVFDFHAAQVELGKFVNKRLAEVGDHEKVEEEERMRSLDEHGSARNSLIFEDAPREHTASRLARHKHQQKTREVVARDAVGEPLALIESDGGLSEDPTAVMHLNEAISHDKSPLAYAKTALVSAGDTGDKTQIRKSPIEYFGPAPDHDQALTTIGRLHRAPEEKPHNIAPTQVSGEVTVEVATGGYPTPAAVPIEKLGLDDDTVEIADEPKSTFEEHSPINESGLQETAIRTREAVAADAGRYAMAKGKRADRTRATSPSEVSEEISTEHITPIGHPTEPLSARRRDDESPFMQSRSSALQTLIMVSGIAFAVLLFLMIVVLIGTC